MKPSQNTILKMRKAVEDSFLDSCYIGSYSETFDSFGDVNKAWTYGEILSCGVDFSSATKTQKDEVVIAGVVGTVRLPYGTNVTHQDRIKLTRTGLEYSIKNIIAGLTCLVVEVEKLEV